MDNKALTYINESSARVIVGWAMEFQEFTFETKFKEGILNVLPHNLSHMYDLLLLDFGRGEKLEVVSEGKVCFVRASGRKEGDLEEVRDVFQENFGDFCGLVAGRGSLVGLSTNSNINKFLKSLGKECPEEEVQKKMVVELHNQNHVGARMMFKMLFSDGFYWPSMFKDCEREAKSCSDCLRFNISEGGFHPMRTITASLPWDHVVWDLIGKLPMSENGFNFVLIMVDVVTRFVVLKPLQTKRAVEIANRLVETFANFGVSKLLQSDNDKALVNETMEEVRKMAGFQFRNIMAYFPRQNGVVERFVEETKSLLKKVIRGDYAAWDVFIPAVQMAMNDRVLSRHGSRPFSVMFGRKMNGFDDYREVSWDEKEGRER